MTHKDALEFLTARYHESFAQCFKKDQENTMSCEKSECCTNLQSVYLVTVFTAEYSAGENEESYEALKSDFRSSVIFGSRELALKYIEECIKAAHWPYSWGTDPHEPDMPNDLTFDLLLPWAHKKPCLVFLEERKVHTSSTWGRESREQ